MRYNKLFSCKDKVALITGGAGRLGSEMAKALKEFGATVYVGDADQRNVEKKIGKDIAFELLDIRSGTSIKKVFEKILNIEKRIDVLINCAYPRTKDWGLKMERVSFGSWKENVDSHLGGYFLCSQLAAEQMKLQKRGSIINMASMYGVVAPDFSIYEGTEMTMPVAYAAIKGGIISFTRYLATYYGGYNVRANAISPGGILDNQSPSFVDRYCKKTPLGRMGTSSDVVGAAVFLASDASSYVTGQNLLVDGGWTAW